MDYKKTIILPKTEFPMKASLPKREPLILEFWDKNEIYKKALEKRKNNEVYILHDGPPYSNGHIHIGHALNKILKDIVVKYKMMSGYYTPFIPGWDNHGMPIENGVIERFRKEGKKITRENVRNECRKTADYWVKIQRPEFRRLGVFGFWESPYLTMKKDYEALILETFASLVERGYVYRSFRPIHWCIHCETALANIEIEYEEKHSPSLWIRFPLKRDTKNLFEGIDKDKIYVLVWTTTPWTIPANLAITFHPDFYYVLIKVGDVYYLLAEDLLKEVVEKLEFKDYKIERRFLGSQLEGEVFQHPIFKKDSIGLVGTFVTKEQGTGCVHTAPGHGIEDFEIGKKYGLPPLSPVDEKGYFTEEAGEFAGISIIEGDKKVVEALKREGNLLKEEEMIHQYPFCWRCHNPLIFRATQQWFMSMEHRNQRKRMLEAIKNVRWYPKESYERIRGFLESRPDWCLSRQKFWGVGIPAFYCKDCGEAVLSPEIIRKVADIIRKESSDAWFDDEKINAETLGVRCPKCGSKELLKETDVLDVWFDSSVSYIYVASKPGHKWPSDMYLEGSDQHRGWFNLSLVVGIAVKDSPPYKNVLTHGFVLDENGIAMHTHLGNVIAPSEIIEKYGAEVLRLWVASIEYFKDVKLSYEIIERLAEAYRKIRNTIRFMLGNLHDFRKEKRVKYEELSPLDKYMLHRMQEIIRKVKNAYENNEFYRVFHVLYNFCVVDLSSFYLDVLKDILYTHPRDSVRRRSAQTVMERILRDLLRLLAPIMSFTSEEAYGHLEEREESIFLEDFPEVEDTFINHKIADEWRVILDTRDSVLKALEVKRKEGKIGSSLDARILIHVKDKRKEEVIKRYGDYLASVFIVSQVEIIDSVDEPDTTDDDIGVEVKVLEPRGRKCARCWIWSETVGKNQKYPDICNKCIEAVKNEQKA